MVDMILQLMGLLFSILVLAVAASILVKSLANIASHKNWSEFTVGILLACATSLPELGVSLIAATKNESNLALGNILGSNIANTTIIIGLVAFFSGSLKVTVREKREDSLVAAAITLLPLLLLFNGTLSRLDGAILLAAYFLYLYHLYQLRTNTPHKLTKAKFPLSTYVVHALFGAFLLIISAKVLVSTATETANSLGLPLVFIGLFVVGLGTSLPELFFGIKAGLKKKSQMALGDILGAIIFNSGFILGLCAIISPIRIHSFSVVLTSAIFLVVAIFVFTFFLRSEYKLSRLEGIILTALFCLFVFLEFNLKVV